MSVNAQALITLSDVVEDLKSLLVMLYLVQWYYF